MREQQSLSNIAKTVQEVTGHEFLDYKLLKMAFTHPSIASKRKDSYERLEFMGDSVLGLVVTDMLYRLYENDSEGDLTRKKVALVCGRQGVKIARSLNLGQILHMSRGEISCGGMDNDSNLENVLEALIGALYIDGGLEVARSFIMRYWKPLAEEMLSVPLRDFKTALQEWAQSRGLDNPLYTVIEKTGLEHHPTFTVEASLVLDCVHSARASGRSKKKAEQSSANLLLQKLLTIHPDSH